ncbi:MAG: LysR family transcriptional regulator [Mangrovicoccus sp.]|nr:LysR family transcriptional regulator [Mangrovicoccus sp.]
MDRLTEMEAFSTVVDQGGFTGAARKLNISKSAVSKHVSSLEARLGVRLLNRTTRRVNPTEIGLVYYERAQQVLAAARDADGMVGMLQGGPEGQLRIAAAPDYGRTVIAQQLPAFLAAYPAVSVDLVLIDRPVELVSEGFDLSVFPGAPGTDIRRARVLDDFALELVATPDYLAAHGELKRVEDLVSHVLIHGGDGKTDGAWRLVTQTREIRTIRGRPKASINSAEAVAGMAKAGLGIALLPDFLIKADLEQGLLQRALPGLPEQKRHILATLPSEPNAKPKAAAFLDFIDRTGAKGEDAYSARAVR